MTLKDVSEDYLELSRQLLEHFSTRNMLGGGAKRYKSIDNSWTNGRSETRKAAIECSRRVLRKDFFLKSFKVTGQVKGQNDSFRFIGCRGQTNNSCRPKVCQNAPQVRNKVPCKCSLYTK